MQNNKKIGVIIVAGGSGTRFGAEIPKQYLPLNGKPVLQHSIEAFSGFADFIQVVIRREDVAIFKAIETELEEHGMQILPPIFGAATRQGSVKNGLIALEKVGCEVVLIHDAARPLVSTQVIENVLNGVEKHHYAIPVVQQKDTLKLGKKGFIEKTISRKNLVCAQTPQGFEFAKIYEAHKKLQDFNYTDDASMVEAMGEKVALVEGDENNLKITTKADLQLAEIILGGSNKMNSVRVGMGFDVHEFEAGDGVILCGIKIAHNKKLKGHSDADVAMHAITDAILGAIGAGDIGEHFPPSEAKWKGADSAVFLKHASEVAYERGYKINNVDVTIIAEEPKITPHKAAMIANIAEILELEKQQINIKATTTEGLGFTGRKEGIAAQAVVSVVY